MPFGVALSNKLPAAMQAIYGTTANGKIAWCGYDLSTLFDMPSPVCISTLTTSEILQDFLCQLFGQEPDD
ncbi:hypothetical protein EON63_16210 [archaeon]|nr:MAG: hypothetical protein EON63_16210 [archaeon]